MKPFQPRSVEQQRKNYVKACKQRMVAEIKDLEEAYSLSHATHAKYYFERCGIEEQIAKVQDRVANAADKEFGGWDTWRHDPDLLVEVVKRMDDAVVTHKERIEKINQRMEAVLAPFRAECQKVMHKYRTLIKTA
jgi:cell division protein ZapA (FtsZ GTPase activity inhibitor)